jgi:hypothetical protein
VIQLVRKSLRQTASFLKIPPGRLASVLWDNSMTSVGSSVALEARLEAGRSTAWSTSFALLGKDQGDWGATDRCVQGIPSVQATDLRTPRNDQPLGGGTSIETRRVATPGRLGCSKLRLGSLREKTPAKKMHVLAIYEDHSESAAPFQEPANSSTPDSAHPYMVTPAHTAHSRTDLNRRPQECPTAPPRGRVGACGEEKLLPGVPNEHIPPEDPKPPTPPEDPPKQSQHGGNIRRCIGLDGWLTGSETWQKVA